LENQFESERWAGQIKSKGRDFEHGQLVGTGDGGKTKIRGKDYDLNGAGLGTEQALRLKRLSTPPKILMNKTRLGSRISCNTATTKEYLRSSIKT
jgi:hypothetical protein